MQSYAHTHAQTCHSTGARVVPVISQLSYESARTLQLPVSHACSAHASNLTQDLTLCAYVLPFVSGCCLPSMFVGIQGLDPNTSIP